MHDPARGTNCICHPFVICRHSVPTRIKKCTKFGQLILRKFIKIVATRCQILRLKCTKFDFGWGSPRPPSWIYGGLILRGGKGGEGKGKREGKEGMRKKESGGREKGKGERGTGDRDGRESLGVRGKGKWVGKRGGEENLGGQPPNVFS